MNHLPKDDRFVEVCIDTARNLEFFSMYGASLKKGLRAAKKRLPNHIPENIEGAIEYFQLFLRNANIYFWDHVKEQFGDYTDEQIFEVIKEIDADYYQYGEKHKVNMLIWLFNLYNIR